MAALPPAVRRVVCYVRKSREDEEAERRGEDTLAKQREMLVHDVLSRYDVEYDIMEEVASGDSIAQRPVFRRLLPLLGSTYQAIVCKDLSRLGRGSYRDMGVVYDTLRQHRVFIITKDAIYNPRNMSDLRMIRFSLFFHREEYEMTLWRLTEGKYDGAARGNWVAGSVPYGYRYNAETQTLQPTPDEADVVRRIFSWYGEERLGYRAIVDRLQQHGYVSPRGNAKWHPEVIRRMLRNPAYRGTLVFRKTERNPLTGRVTERPSDERIVVENAFPAIVPQALWEQCQTGAIRETPAARATRSAGPSMVWELAGVVHCGACAGKLVRQASNRTYRRKDGTTSVYSREFLYCPRCRYAVKYRDCETQLECALRALPFEQPRWQHAFEVGTRHRRSSRASHGSNVGASPLTARLKRARTLLLDGILTREEYLEVKRECERVAAAGSEGADMKPVEEWEPWRNAHNWQEVYRSLRRPSSRNMLLKQLFQQVRLTRVQKGGRRNRPTRFDLVVVPRRLD
ncbi:recombinase family protein [Alicyclobacillus contaminans]|uniref:recombinase family protein n=1 Tax=Alicyclobacillus contaminans TaxID=392016 RepID=UPI000406FB75|nr:recombinase family protein [Alicyclobacillus contaminans]